MADGSRHSLYAIEEATRGTTPASPAWDTLRITGTTLALTRETFVSEEIRSDRQIGDVRGGANSVAGDISFEVSADTFDDLLEGALQGSWAGARLDVGSDRHYYTFMRHFADVTGKPYQIFTGCEINSMSLSINANAIATGTFSVVGKGMVTAASAPTGSSYTAPTTTQTMDSFSGSINEGGVTLAVVTGVELTIENGIEPRYVIGQQDSISPTVGRSNLTGTVTAIFENGTLLDKFLGDTASSLELVLTDGSNSLTLTLPRIKYTGANTDVSGEGDIPITLPFQAILDPTEDTNFFIERV